MQFSETLTEKHVCGHLCTTRSSSAATTVGHPRTSSWSAGIPARIALPIESHHKTCHAKPVDRGRRVQSLTRLHLVKPCRRGRRRCRGASGDLLSPSAQAEPQPSTVLHPPRTPSGIHEPHPGPRASLPESIRSLRRGIRQRRLGIQPVHEVIHEALEHLIFNIHLVYRDVFLQERFHRPA